MVLARDVQRSQPGWPPGVRPGARVELGAHAQVDAALRRTAIPRVAGALVEREQEADGAGSDVVVEGRVQRDPREPRGEPRTFDRHLGDPASGGELHRHQQVAGPSRRLEILRSSRQAMRREQQQPGGGRAGAPDHQQIPVCEPERGGDALGHLHDRGEGMRPLARGSIERPATVRALARRERVDGGGEGRELCRFVRRLIWRLIWRHRVRGRREQQRSGECEREAARGYRPSERNFSSHFLASSGSTCSWAGTWMPRSTAGRARIASFQRVRCGMSSIGTSAQKWMRTQGQVAMSAIE